MVSANELQAAAEAILFAAGEPLELSRLAQALEIEEESAEQVLLNLAASLDELAVIAYNQPVTKSFVEQVRGVDCSGVIATLCQKQLIEEKGRLDLPGRPLLYGTTPEFLRCFSVSSLDELPELPNHDAEKSIEAVMEEAKEEESEEPGEEKENNPEE